MDANRSETPAHSSSTGLDLQTEATQSETTSDGSENLFYAYAQLVCHQSQDQLNATSRTDYDRPLTLSAAFSSPLAAHELHENGIKYLAITCPRYHDRARNYSRLSKQTSSRRLGDWSR